MSGDSYFYKADRLFNEGKLEEAFEAFLLGASFGDTSCMTRVALMYADGDGVEKNIEKSIEWDVKAAEKGDQSGALNAAMSFKQINMQESAIKFLEMALNLGNGEAAFELALIYADNVSLFKKYLDICISHENVSDLTRQNARELRIKAR